MRFENESYRLVCRWLARNTIPVCDGSVHGRKRSGFLLPISGSVHYEFDKLRFSISPGELVYIPKNSSYIYRVKDEPSTLLRIEFDLYKTIDGNESDVMLSDTPLKLSVAETEFKQKFTRIIDSVGGGVLCEQISAISEIWQIIALVNASLDDLHSRIDAGVEYINNHFLDKIYISEAAAASHVSESRFRFLFKKKYGISPLKYRNSLVTKAAVKLLDNPLLSVSDVADSLRFGDIYSFSKFFKQNYGVSPEEYRKRSEFIIMQ